MTELHRHTDKFIAEVQILIKQLRAVSNEPESRELELAVSQAKRVRRSTNIVVRALAHARDETLTD